MKHRTVERMVQVWYNDVMLALYIYISRIRGGPRVDILVYDAIASRNTDPSKGSADAREILTRTRCATHFSDLLHRRGV